MPCGGIENRESKISDPEGPALIIPREGLVCRYLTIYEVLEYWSGGVMEENPFSSISENRYMEKI
jgi:hypothetical protein